MTRRSQEKTRERYGVDSSGWNGVDIPTPARFILSPRAVNITGTGSAPVTVRLMKDGAPVVGATVLAVTSDAGVATEVVSGVTDGSGEATVTVTGVAAGSCTIKISAAGAYDTNIGVVTV